MRHIVVIVIALLLLGALAQGGAWSAPVLTWIDARGFHSLPLELWYNPDYTGDPLSVEKQFMWRGILNDDADPAYNPSTDFMVVINDFSQIVFTCSGNFIGTSPTSETAVWQEVYLYQHVDNETSSAWTGFNLALSDLTPDPNPNKHATFYNVREYTINGATPDSWSFDQGPYYQNYYYDEYLGYPLETVPVGGIFYDLAKVASDVDWTTGDGGFILTKQAIPEIPEPGMLTVLLTGVAGLGLYIKRRKA